MEVVATVFQASCVLFFKRPSRNYVTAKRSGGGKKFALREVRKALRSAPKSRFWRYGTGGGGTKIAILALRNFWTIPNRRHTKHVTRTILGVEGGGVKLFEQLLHKTRKIGAILHRISL